MSKSDKMSRDKIDNKFVGNEQESRIRRINPNREENSENCWRSPSRGLQKEDNKSFTNEQGEGLRISRTNVNRENNWRSCSTNQKEDNEPFAHWKNRSKKRSNQVPYVMSFKTLEELVETNVDNIILAIVNDKKGFSEMLKKSMSGDALVLIIKVLRKICDSTFDDAKLFTLRTTLDTHFMENLMRFISASHTHTDRDKSKNSYFWKEPEQIICNILHICESYLKIMPTQACLVFKDIINKISVQMSILPSLQNVQFSLETVKKVEDLNKMIETVKAKFDKPIPKRKVCNKLEEPPNNFREISIFPTTVELTTQESPFLRKNIIKGPYKDVEQYLDIQFRLLREDFIGPLRSSILSYLDPQNKSRLENIRIYKEVRFLKSEVITQDACYRLQFEKIGSKKKQIDYENSRRFMFGSLLCFTYNNFQSIFFGTVARTEIEDLRNGQLIVGFKTKPQIQNRPYLMVECGIYFEPYFHVLDVLKRMNPNRFPMEKYIINVEPKVELPLYLRDNSRELIIENKCISPHNFPHSFYGLNDAQSSAFQAALTRELAIIQGPPGTGKTFLGLKIVKTLLKNMKLWYNRSPILVICYTNHALDQFLEGILQFTNKLIRIGGQSKNEALMEYNISTKRDKDAKSELFYVHQRLNFINEYIKRIGIAINKIDENRCIISFETMLICQDFNFDDSWFNRRSNAEILNWLFEGSYRNEENVYKEKTIRHTREELDIDENRKDEFDFLFEWEMYEDLKEIYHKDRIILNEVMHLDNYDIVLNELIKKQVEAESAGKLDEVQRLIEEYQMSDMRFKYLEKRLEQKSILENMEIDYENLFNPEKMSLNDRWIFYFNCLKNYRKFLEEHFTIFETRFRHMVNVLEDIKKSQDVEIMKNSLVIGMTTTGAARLHRSLEALKNPIVIVEEAAEVLESHIVSALTKDCQHLILIGDHKQLRPSTGDYNIETQYKLGISLFERMVLNGISCFTLNIQHRMRPEISSLITPAIYPTLIDHRSVKYRYNIRGIDKNLFFIHHTNSECESSDSSKKNLHEANFLIELARYLILNDYKPNEITILAAYLEQMFEINKMKQKYNIMKDVRVCVLDNYQGEESKIILLSLVRNNNNNSIGFLKIENRVCVALSRARDGLYIMGNMDLLCNNSEIWPKIREKLEEQNALGVELDLRCQIHTNNVTKVRNSEDFFKIPEGGCNEICDELLECGHTCKEFCHIQDRIHVYMFGCRKTCLRALCENETHRCQKLCMELCEPCTYPKKCILKCGHEVEMKCHEDPAEYKCTVKVMVTLPCNHNAYKPCHKDEKEFLCPLPCDYRIEICGHVCKKTCHIFDDPTHSKYKCQEKCSKPRIGCMQPDSEKHICSKLCFEDCIQCKEDVKKERKCGHYYSVPCSTIIDEVACTKPCKLELPCGHKCKRKCNEPCGGCRELVEKKVPGCEHLIKIVCQLEADRKYCQKFCPRLLSCGHKCTKKCCDDCTDICMEMVKCEQKITCGHILSEGPCYLFSNESTKNSAILEYCTNPCVEILSCGHNCSGTCGKCYQNRFHVMCNEKCNSILICNHPSQKLCNESYKPCQRRCEYGCIHNKCFKKCGEGCDKCNKKCPRYCEHQICDKTCSEDCSVPPCSEPCLDKLKCDHACIGFCGDPCPPLCRICDKDKILEILEKKDNENARFVILKECGHIVENEAMKTWLQDKFSTTGELLIELKCCPICKITISSTNRYNEYIKENRQNIVMIFKELHQKDIAWTIHEKDTKIDRIIRNEHYKDIGNKIKDLIKTFNHILKFKHYSENKIFSQYSFQIVNIKLELIEYVLEIIQNNFKSDFTKFITQFNFIIDRMIFMHPEKITDQQIKDILLEIAKLQRFLQYEKLTSSSLFMEYISQRENLKILSEGILLTLEKPARYSLDLDKELLSKLIELQNSIPMTDPVIDVQPITVSEPVDFSKDCWLKCHNGHIYRKKENTGNATISECDKC